MSNNISSFGFNMGAKMGEFGIFESNSAPTPPIPQPKYVVVNISFASGSISGYVSNINTTGVNITNVNYSVDHAVVSFDSPIASITSVMYCEAMFNETWYAPSTDAIPLFQVVASPTQIDIYPVDFDKNFTLTDGDFQLSIIVFE
jgi:hypothetical protein